MLLYHVVSKRYLIMVRKKNILLGVNVDHVATLRQARGTPYPDPVAIALIAEENGADSITCLLYTSPSPRDATLSRMPSSA